MNLLLSSYLNKKHKELVGSMTATPLSDVSSRTELSNRLNKDDEIIARFITVQYFDSFPKQVNRGMLFTKADDTNIAAVLAAANGRNVTILHYNLEWPGHTWDEIRDQLILTRNALISAGDIRPLIFGPIKTLLDTHIADYAPYCDGFAWQLQNATSLSVVPGLVLSAVTTSHTALPNCPVYIQMNSYSEGEYEIENCVRIISHIPGVSGINLYFGGSVNWLKCWNVIKKLRP